MNTAEESPAPQRSDRSRPGALTVVAVALVLIGLTATLFNSYRSGREKLFTAAHSQDGAEIAINVLLREVDTAKGELRMRVFATPVDADSFEHSYEIESANETAKEPMKIAKGTAFASADATISFDDGEDLLYPFDSYGATFYLVVRELTEDTAGDAVPAAFTVEASNASYRFSLSDASEDDGLIRAVDIRLRRAPVPIAMAVVMSALMLTLSFIVTRVALLIATGRRKFEFASLTWMAAMLFAFVGFRNAAPGTPVMGSLFDFMGFFWAELAVGYSLIRVGLFYVTKIEHKTEDRT